MSKVRIGLLGSGTVGEAVQRFIFSKAIRGTVGTDVELEIVKIYTRHPEKKNWYPTHQMLFTKEPKEVIDHPEVDIIVEVLGTEDEKDIPVFRDHVIRSFQKGKDVVTSDKSVLARFGEEIWSASRQYRRELRFEACVGGGIPIIRSLTESLSAEEPEAIFVIINGTCNYVLSEMEKGGKSYEEALQEAQGLKYAEPDPTTDVSGKDAEAKLILLETVMFGLYEKPGAILLKGIQDIDPVDFHYADRKGSCTIKHLAVAERNDNTVQAFVSPVLVPHDHFLSTIRGRTNAVFFKGKRSEGVPIRQQADTARESRDWNYVFVGPGAGGEPTAVAILGDVYDLARKRTYSLPAPPSLIAPGTLVLEAEDQISACFYVRFVVNDRPGIVGEICEAFGQEEVNIAEVWQLNHSKDELQRLTRNRPLGGGELNVLPFVITLEQTTVGQIKRVLGIIHKKDFILDDPVWFPIWRN